MSDHNQLKYVIQICRMEAIMILGCSFLMFLLLIIALSCDPSPDDDDFTDLELFSKFNFIVITTISIFAIVSSILLLVAVNKKNHWLSVPFAILHVFMILFCFSFLIAYLVKASESKLIALQEDFIILSSPIDLLSYNLARNQGSYIVFSILLLMGFFITTSFPLYAFFNECRLLNGHRRVFIETGSMVPNMGSEIDQDTTNRRSSKTRRKSKVEEEHPIARGSIATVVTTQ